MHTPTFFWIALTPLLALGCVPNPPEAEPPEVEVSGGELPEYDNHEADLDEVQDDDDSIALELDMSDRHLEE